MPALLVVDAGRLVPMGRLVDGLFGEESPSGVVNAVQPQVSRLRAVLGDVIERQPRGHRLTVDPVEVDAHSSAWLPRGGRPQLRGRRAGRWKR